MVLEKCRSIDLVATVFNLERAYDTISKYHVLTTLLEINTHGKIFAFIKLNSYAILKK